MKYKIGPNVKNAKYGEKLREHWKANSTFYAKIFPKNAMKNKRLAKTT